MINFSDLNKAQMRYLEHNDMFVSDIIYKDIINHNKTFDRVMSLIIENVLTTVVKKGKMKLSCVLQDAKEITKIRLVVEAYEIPSLDVTIGTIYHLLEYGDFNTKRHIAWLADVFGYEKVHSEFFMEALKCTMSAILYAILYV